MARITTWLPVNGLMKFDAEIDTKGKIEEEILEEFKSNYIEVDSFCHQCQDFFQFDYGSENVNDLSYDQLQIEEEDD